MGLPQKMYNSSTRVKVEGIEGVRLELNICCKGRMMHKASKESMEEKIRNRN